MKKKLKSFEGPKDFSMLSEIKQIVRGFALAKPIIQKALITRFEKKALTMGLVRIHEAERHHIKAIKLRSIATIRII